MENTKQHENDLMWLRKTIELSKRCTPSTTAFSVGAIIVSADNECVGTGYSREDNSRAHAEEIAIRKAKEQNVNLKGATIYSSLEPCAIRLSGATPCVKHIVECGIARIVFAMVEPPIFVKGGGHKALTDYGLEVLHLEELAFAVLEINKHLTTKSQ